MICHKIHIYVLSVFYLPGKLALHCQKYGLFSKFRKCVQYEIHSTYYIVPSI